MNTILIQRLSDSELLTATENTVLQERELTNLVLEHLHEIERRRLYATLGFSSLFDYCTKHLKYCNASAQLRIDAMRLAKEIPEIKESLESGSLNLSVIGTFQKFVRHEKSNHKNYSTEEKKEFIKQIENKSNEAAERLFSEIAPGLISRENKRVISSTQTEIKFVANQELLELMDQMKAKLMQKGNSNPSFAEIIGEALKKALKVPRGEAQSLAPVGSTATLSDAGDMKRGTSHDEASPVSPEVATSSVASSDEVGLQTKSHSPSRRPYVPVSIRRFVFNKAGHQCSFVSLLSGRRCSETRFLQIEHIKPFAKGGGSDLGNYSVLCHSHNLTQAIEQFGIKKMQPYLKL